MDNEERAGYVRFEYVTEFGFRTVMEQDIDTTTYREFDAMVEAYRNFLLACTFSAKNIEEVFPSE